VKILTSCIILYKNYEGNFYLPEVLSVYETFRELAPLSSIFYSSSLSKTTCLLSLFSS